MEVRLRVAPEIQGVLLRDFGKLQYAAAGRRRGLFGRLRTICLHNRVRRHAPAQREYVVPVQALETAFS